MNFVLKLYLYCKYIYLKNFGTYDQKLEIDILENEYDYNKEYGLNS